MSPFRPRSLTHAIDLEIHRLVRKASPHKYWCFRLSDIVMKTGVSIATLAFAACLLLSSITLPTDRLANSAFDEIFQSLLLLITLGLGSAVICDIVRDGLLKDLEVIAGKFLKNA